MPDMATEISIHRTELRLIGDAHDINRVVEAGKAALLDYEHKKRDPSQQVTIIVHEPSPDDP